MLRVNEPVTVLANGSYPIHSVPLDILKKSKTIVCCDGATNNLEKNNLTPSVVIGDMDSIEHDLLKKYNSICIKDKNQNENDLRKALMWLNRQNINSVSIVGATGKRDDHSMANILSVLEIGWDKELYFYTDHGIFSLINNQLSRHSYTGQNVSFFFLDRSIKFSTKGLKYKLKNQALQSIYMGTLNKSNGSIILSQHSDIYSTI